MRKRQERPLEAANAADADADANRRPRKAYGIDASVRKARLAQGADAAQRLVLGMRKARPAVCEWLSRERHVLPEIVNVVYMLELRSAHYVAVTQRGVRVRRQLECAKRRRHTVEQWRRFYRTG